MMMMMAMVVMMVVMMMGDCDDNGGLVAARKWLVGSGKEVGRKKLLMSVCIIMNFNNKMAEIAKQYIYIHTFNANEMLI